MKRLAAALYIMMCSSLAHGATLLFSDDFEGVNPLSTNYSGCTNGTTPTGRVAISTVQAHGGTHSAYYHSSPPGDQTSVCYADLAGGSYNNFYISIWMYMTTDLNFTGHGWRLYAPGNSGPQFDNNVNGTGTNVEWDIDPIIDVNHNITFSDSFVFAKGQWVRMEIEFHQGTGEDGTIRAWFTDSGGLHKWANPSMSGLHHDCDSCSVNGCTGCHWTPALTLTQFALSTNVDDGTGGWFIDDIQIWDGCPGSGNYTCVSGGGDTTPPAAPRNVRVQ